MGQCGYEPWVELWNGGGTTDISGFRLVSERAAGLSARLRVQTHQISIEQHSATLYRPGDHRVLCLTSLGFKLADGDYLALQNTLGRLVSITQLDPGGSSIRGDYGSWALRQFGKEIGKWDHTSAMTPGALNDFTLTNMPTPLPSGFPTLPPTSQPSKRCCWGVGGRPRIRALMVCCAFRLVSRPAAPPRACRRYPQVLVPRTFRRPLQP